MIENKNSINNDNLEKIINNIYDTNESFSYTFVSSSILDTSLLATSFAKHLKKGDILVLNGELGSGKTVFVQALAKFFDIENQVCSPTFTIVNEYDLKNKDKIFHFDVYRLEDENDFEDSIGTEYFSNGICVIEWGNVIQNIIPKRAIYIDITKDDNDEFKRYFKIWRN